MRATAAPDHRPERTHRARLGVRLRAVRPAPRPCRPGPGRRSPGRRRPGPRGRSCPQGRVVRLAPRQDGVGQVAGLDRGHEVRPVADDGDLGDAGATHVDRGEQAAEGGGVRRPATPADELQDLLGLVRGSGPRRSARRGAARPVAASELADGRGVVHQVLLAHDQRLAVVGRREQPAVGRRPRSGRAGCRPPRGPRRSSGPRRWPRPGAMKASTSAAWSAARAWWRAPPSACHDRSQRPSSRRSWPSRNSRVRHAPRPASRRGPVAAAASASAASIRRVPLGEHLVVEARPHPLLAGLEQRRPRLLDRRRPQQVAPDRAVQDGVRPRSCPPR